MSDPVWQDAVTVRRTVVVENGRCYPAEVEQSLDGETVVYVGEWKRMDQTALAAYLVGKILTDQDLDLREPAVEPIRREPRPGRNKLCQCGSGMKWKRCCGQRKESK